MTTSKHYYIVCTDPLKILEGPFGDWGNAHVCKNAYHHSFKCQGIVTVMTAFQFEQLYDELEAT